MVENFHVTYFFSLDTLGRSNKASAAAMMLNLVFFLVFVFVLFCLFLLEAINTGLNMNV